MLDKKTLENFIQEIEHTWSQFCVWKYTNDKLVEHMPIFESDMSSLWSVDTEEFLRKNRKFQNFWNVVLPTLQHGWIMAIARLMDEAYFQKNKNKPNLSLKYIIEQLPDFSLRDAIEQQMSQNQKFINSILEWRNKALGHNDINFNGSNINAGFENYIEFLTKTIEKIQTAYPELAVCIKPSLEFIDRVSQKGVEEIFENLSQNRGD